MDRIVAARKLGASIYLDTRGPCHMVVSQVVLDACSQIDAEAIEERLCMLADMEVSAISTEA